MPLITDTTALETFISGLRSAKYVTIDTEFIRDTTYWPKLCLVQLAAAAGARAVDPLAPGIDLTPLYDLLFDPRVLKVFHACRQDMEIVYHATGRLPTPIFDTQVAAMVCGYGEAASYETLVKQIVGARLDKSARFTDWSRRPLSERQIEYALGDVTHLRVIYEHLAERLAHSGREGWVAEEMAILTDPATYRLDPGEAWKRIKTRSSSPTLLARLKVLAEWREKEAQERDLPRNRIVRDEVLLEIAAHPPETPSALSQVRGLSKGFEASRLGKGLWQAIERARAAPIEAVPDRTKRGRPRTTPPPVAELLKVLLRIRCREAGVAARLVASSADIDRLAVDSKADVKALTGWRYELFGRDALALKAGQIALTADGKGEVEIVEIED
ncbi:MAG: ribonuclease D [Rhodothalassiaceae bacterium]